MTFNMPSIAGKVFGTTALTDYTQLTFWLSAESGLDSLSGFVGVQSGTINLWGVQVEVGGLATALEKPSLAHELHECRWFFERVIFEGGVIGIGTTGPDPASPPTASGVMIPYQAKRTIPILSLFNASDILVAGSGISLATFTPARQFSLAAFTATVGSTTSWNALPVTTATGIAYVEVIADL